jgi:hypothetical protein
MLNNNNKSVYSLGVPFGRGPKHPPPHPERHFSSSSPNSFRTTAKQYGLPLHTSRSSFFFLQITERDNFLFSSNDKCHLQLIRRSYIIHEARNISMLLAKT